ETPNSKLQTPGKFQIPSFKRGDRSGAKTPNFKLQTPEKFQIPSFKRRDRSGAETPNSKLQIPSFKQGLRQKNAIVQFAPAPEGQGREIVPAAKWWRRRPY